ncbi:MAG TPA: PLP-dependent aminotransferase family protein [Kofleriaceae bacterium]|nr:PLP-dependent aminotransferase family protein [Kofleriaceae bacterium]
MRAWTFPVAVDAASTTPLFLQISRAISDDVTRGRLRPGDPLPGTRSLADELGVHRATIVAAYEELIAQGWATARSGHATTIAPTSPDVAARRSRSAPAHTPRAAGYELSPVYGDRVHAPPAITQASTISLWGGVPDTRLIDLDVVGRALRRATRTHGRSLLRYADDPRGHPALRTALASMLAASRGLAITADDVVVTSGSQQALGLVAHALVRPGDAVAIEALGYRPAWAAFSRAGAELLPLTVDEEGLRTAELAALLRRRRIRALYVTPHHQYPTTVVMSPRRRASLLELARAHRFAIIEDDYDHEFHFEGRPVLPIASADRTGQVIYVGGLAKSVAPGLRIGYVVAPPTVLSRLADERAICDRHGSRVVEAAVAELLDDGHLQRHIRRARRIYLERRDALATALRKKLGDRLAFDVPAGGLTLWARADGIEVEAWRERAARKNVLVQSGKSFTFDRSRLACIRLGYAAGTPRELTNAVDILASTATHVR